jgi:LemA protein
MVAIGAVIYLIIGGFSLASAQENVRGLTGQVWNANQRGVDVLGRLEGQLSVALADRQDLVKLITDARKAAEDAQASGDLDAVEAARQQAQLAINVIFENYPDLSLTPLQVGLMDETAGSLNRIAYARSELIKGQVSYNVARLFFFPLSFVFPRMEVLGEFSDPSLPFPTSSFGATSAP